MLTITARFAVVFALTAALPACNSGGSSGGGFFVAAAPVLAAAEVEPNETAPTASAMSSSGAGEGELITFGDIDYWSFSAVAGERISIELFGARFDQSEWDSASAFPVVSLIGTDGTTVLLYHDPFDYDDNSWETPVDMDHAAYEIPATGVYYLVVESLDVDSDPVSGGSYALRVQDVSFPAPIQTELEAVGATGGNDTSATAEPVVPGTIHGWHVEGEVDFYAFTADPNTIVHFETTAYRSGIDGAEGSASEKYYDTEIDLFAANGTTVLLTNDDTIWYDSGAEYLLATGGTYFIRVTQCCGDADHDYFLTFSAEPTGSALETEANDTFATANAIAYGSIVSGSVTTVTDSQDFFSFSGSAGDMVRVALFDDSNTNAPVGSASQTFLDTDGTTSLADGGPAGGFQHNRTILPSSGTFYVSITTGASSNYAFKLELVRSAAFETEPNDSSATAGGLDGNGRASGVIDPASDVDAFAFTAVQGELVVFAVYGSDSYADTNQQDFGSNLQPFVTIEDSMMGFMADATVNPSFIGAESFAGSRAAIEVAFVAPAAGTYYLFVEDDGGNGGSDYRYVVERR